MAVINRKLSDGSERYQARVRQLDGRWYPSLFHANRLDAECEETKLKKQRRDGGGDLNQDARRTTVAEYWAVWCSNNRSSISPGWKISQDQMFEDYVRGELGAKLLSQVTPAHIGRVLNRMRDPKQMPDGRARSEQTILKVYNLLHKMFGDARAYWRMDIENPVLPAHHRPRVKAQESAYLEPAQSWALLEAARDHYCGPAVWLELLAGLRCEATVALKWDCVLWEHDQIIIRRAWKAKIRRIEEFPKGGRQEFVPMTPLLKEFLWTKRQGHDAFVCQSVTGGMLSPSTYAPNLRKLCAKAGVPVVSPHALRHSASELFVQAGATAEDVRRLLNHKSLSVTKRYLHRSDERLAAIASRVTGPGLRVIPGGGDVPTGVPIREQTDVSRPFAEGREAIK